MHIGTAVPNPEELNEVTHHFIQHKSITEDYSVGTFEKDAIRCIETLFETHDVVVMVGGSGLYVNAVTEGLDDFPDIDPNIRVELNKRLKNEGLKVLQEQLNDLDPKAYSNTQIENPHRVIRALEVCIGSEQPYSSFLNKKQVNRPFDIITIGLTADRALIYDRINQRVDDMIKNGLVEEAKALLPYRHLNALNTVGYKELFYHFNGEWTLAFAISEIKKNTRRFAKRQMTWFKRNDDLTWFDYNASLNDIIDFIKNKKSS